MTTPNYNSILTSIKKQLGLADEDTSFDPDIIIHINSALFRLNQLGVGEEPFVVTDSNDEWSDAIPDNYNLEVIKSYIFLKVKKVFDPPTGSILLQALNESISEYEWTINVAAEKENKNA